jgi:hypothetical protein
MAMVDARQGVVGHRHMHMHVLPTPFWSRFGFDRLEGHYWKKLERFFWVVWGDIERN